MDKNFTPIKEETYNQKQVNKEISEPKKEQPKKEECLDILPEWSIEPPLEIKRGQNDVR